MNDLLQTLKRFNFTPKKSLGQNFLFDEAILGRIVDAGEVTRDDLVLEIGPGVGSLTRRLAVAAAQVVAVELDQRLLPILAYTLADHPNAQIIHGDILEVDLAQILQPYQSFKSYKVVANIPYYLTSAIIRRLLEAPLKPSLITLTVQREVAQRLCAVPPEMSVLAVSVQVYGTPRLAGKIPAGAFYPQPEVDSAIVRVDLFPQLPFSDQAKAEKFFEIVKAGFSQKRKKLKNSLAAGLKLPVVEIERWLTLAEIDGARRAETLSVEEWLRLKSISRQDAKSAEKN